MRMRWNVLFVLCTFAQGQDTLYEVLKQPPLSSQNNPLRSVNLPSHTFDLLSKQKDYLPYVINVNEEIPVQYSPIIEDTIYLQAVMLSSIGMLALLPESVTNWSEEKLQDKSLWRRWKDNVTSTPVWDDDSWVINYIGHPVSGAYYYTMARNDGMSISESAAFSTLMSTFFWEYGYEAFAEIPSIQDLILTPVMGSIMGEGLMVLQKKLNDQDGILWGSKKAGNIAYFFIDPLGNIAHGLESIFVACGLNPTVTLKFHTYPYAAKIREFPYPRQIPEDRLPHDNRQYGFIITIE